MLSERWRARNERGAAGALYHSGRLPLNQRGRENMSGKRFAGKMIYLRGTHNIIPVRILAFSKRLHRARIRKMQHRANHFIQRLTVRSISEIPSKLMLQILKGIHEACI